jgi:hypothetical protein
MRLVVTHVDRFNAFSSGDALLRECAWIKDHLQHDHVTDLDDSFDQAAALRLPSTVSKTTHKQIVEQTLQGQYLLAHLA